MCVCALRGRQGNFRCFELQSMVCVREMLHSLCLWPFCGLDHGLLRKMARTSTIVAQIVAKRSLLGKCWTELGSVDLARQGGACLQHFRASSAPKARISKMSG